MQIRCRAPYDWPQLLGFFAGRATPGVETVDGEFYRRTLKIGARSVVIEVGPGAEENSLTLKNLTTGRPPGPELLQRTRRVFDVDAPVNEIVSVLSTDRSMSRFLEGRAGVRVPGAFDGFELTVRAILGQQISVKAATTIAGRIAHRYGEPIAGVDGLDRLFPTPERLARRRFNGLGLVQARINTIRDLSKAVLSGDLVLDGSQPVAETCASLMSIKGIGDWTTQYVAMRALRDADAFPASDLGLLSAIEYPARVTARELGRRAEQWRPWRAYAAMLLWGSLPGAGG